MLLGSLFRMEENKKKVTDLQGPVKLVNVQGQSLEKLVMTKFEFFNDQTVVNLEDYVGCRMKHYQCAGVLRNVRKKNSKLLDIFRLNFRTVGNFFFFIKLFS